MLGSTAPQGPELAALYGALTAVLLLGVLGVALVVVLCRAARRRPRIGT